jgi:hypothetical protein
MRARSFCQLARLPVPLPPSKMSASKSPLPRKLRAWVGDDLVLVEAILACQFRPILGLRDFKDGELIPLTQMKFNRHTAMHCNQAITSSPKMLQLACKLFEARIRSDLTNPLHTIALNSV